MAGIGRRKLSRHPFSCGFEGFEGLSDSSEIRFRILLVAPFFWSLL